mmetsp:Transcript_1854/g.3871  ORF Transcript_1854/g.3871 Transcript_1854/m.3871 type:complete len:394 (+) Transcript_1854:222-1403(+)
MTVSEIVKCTKEVVRCTSAFLKSPVEEYLFFQAESVTVLRCYLALIDSVPTETALENQPETQKAEVTAGDGTVNKKRTRRGGRYSKKQWGLKREGLMTSLMIGHPDSHNSTVSHFNVSAHPWFPLKARGLAQGGMQGFETTREHHAGIPAPVQSPSTSLLKSPSTSLLKESSSVSASADINYTPGPAPTRSPSTSLPKGWRKSIPASAVANCTPALARSPPTSLLKECSSAFSPTDANCTPAPARSPSTPPPKERPSFSTLADANCTPAAGELRSPSTSFTQESPSVFSYLGGSSALLPAKDAPISSFSSLAPASSVSLTARDSSEVERREKNTEWGRQFVAIGKKATYGSLMAMQILKGVKFLKSKQGSEKSVRKRKGHGNSRRLYQLQQTA